MAILSRPALILATSALSFGTSCALRSPDAPIAAHADGAALLEASASAAEEEAFPFYRAGALAVPFVGRSGVRHHPQHGQLQAPRRDGAGPLHMLLDPTWQPKLMVFAKFVKAVEEDQEVDLVLPPEWADNLDLDREVVLMKRSWHAVGRHRTSIYQASSKHAPHHELVIKVTDADDHQSERELQILHQISYLAGQGSIDTWGIMPCYESRTNSRQSLYLMPRADSDLQEHLMNRRVNEMMKQREAQATASSSDEVKQKTPQQELFVPLPLEEALIMTIDLLHGVESLHRAGIIDGDLSPENVLIKDGRAFITDFGHSAIMEPNGEDPKNTHVGMRSLLEEESKDEDFVGHAYRHAPEMVEGVPFSPKQSVWAVGLLLAEMVLGRCPTIMEAPKDLLDLDHDKKGREEMRRRIREEFNIADAEGFSDLPVQLQEILQGMLERYSARRLHVDKARQLLEVFASSQGYELPAMAEWPDLSEQWHVQLQA